MPWRESAPVRLLQIQAFRGMIRVDCIHSQPILLCARPARQYINLLSLRFPIHAIHLAYRNFAISLPPPFSRIQIRLCPAPPSRSPDPPFAYSSPTNASPGAAGQIAAPATHSPSRCVPCPSPFAPYSKPPFPRSVQNSAAVALLDHCAREEPGPTRCEFIACEHSPPAVYTLIATLRGHTLLRGLLTPW